MVRETSDMVRVPTENTKDTKIKIYMKLDYKSQQITQITQKIESVKFMWLYVDKRKSSNETNETNNLCNSCNSLTIKESHQMKRMKLIIRVIRVIRWSTNETNETNKRNRRRRKRTQKNIRVLRAIRWQQKKEIRCWNIN